MCQRLCSAPCLVWAVLAVTTAAAEEGRLIATGWDSPSPARFRKELAAFEAWQAFDGTTIAATCALPDGRLADARNVFSARALAVE